MNLVDPLGLCKGGEGSGRYRSQVGNFLLGALKQLSRLGTPSTLEQEDGASFADNVLQPIFIIGSLGVGEAAAVAEEGAAVAESGAIDITLYRSVSSAEMADIQASGAFRMGPNSSMGKWFAETPEDAATWARELGNDGGVVGARVPSGVAESAFRIDRLDGIGPARYIEGEYLPRVEPIP